MRWGTPHEISRERWRSPHGDAWFDWFAWYPVETMPPNDRWVWLEWVQKRYYDGMTFYLPYYRLPPSPVPPQDGE